MAGPYFDFSVPEPTGVVAVIAPQESSLLGLVSVLAPVMATGCTAVVVASETRPLAAVTLSRGAGHIRRAGRGGQHPDRADGRAGAGAGAHMDVNAIDLTGAGCRPSEVAELQRAAADNVKRVFRPSSRASTGAATPVWRASGRSWRSRRCGTHGGLNRDGTMLP